MSLKVAIIGRPNVGKSTLFNRLAGRRIALVHDNPGVTRDRKITAITFRDLDLELIDTAGFELGDESSMEARMLLQTKQAIKDAQKAKYDAIADFSKKYGKYSVIYTGEKAFQEMERARKYMDSLFRNFWI